MCCLRNSSSDSIICCDVVTPMFPLRVRLRVPVVVSVSVPVSLSVPVTLLDDGDIVTVVEVDPVVES